MPSAGCTKTRTLQDGNRTITSGGMSRMYYLKTPSNYDNKHPYRLIFTFHWFYGSINAVVNPPDAATTPTGPSTASRISRATRRSSSRRRD